MSLMPPLYCALCAAPCYLPPHRVPRWDAKPAAGPDTSNPIQSADAISIAQQGWLHTWEVLRVSSGLLPAPILPPNSHIPADTDTQRQIPIHSYCLNAVLKTTMKSMYFSGSTHDESMMVGWSLPKWTGYGPWVRGVSGGGTAFLGALEKKGAGVGYWAGLGVQKDRWTVGVEGSHLHPVRHLIYENTDEPG